MSKRRWLWWAGGLGAAGGIGALAYSLWPKSHAAAEPLPRATSGPLVSDEEWDADYAYVNERLKRRQITADWATEVFDEGEGEPILCIPIVTHVEVIYARQLREFGRDHRVITYRRPEGKDAPITIPERAEEVRRLLDGLGLERVHILARSEGAMVAAEFARRYPERCRSLVMITIAMDYTVQPVIMTDFKNWFMEHLPIEKLVTDDAVRHEVVSYLSGEGQRLTYDQVMRVYKHIPDFRLMYKYSAVPLILHHDLRGKAQEITVPTLLIGSDEDERGTREGLDELAAALPDCRGAHLIAQGGLFVNYIQGDETNRLIRDFYAQLSADAAHQATAH